MMVRVEVNKHAEVIKEQVFHTFPYNQFIPNFIGPHADDCPGCIIETELQILVDKLVELSPVENIIAELEAANETVKTLNEDKNRAFEIVGFSKEGSVFNLVTTLVEQRDRLNLLLNDIKQDLNNTISKLRE